MSSMSMPKRHAAMILTALFAMTVIPVGCTDDPDSDPVEQTDPSDPSDASDPSDGSDPSDQSDASTPSDPSDPSDPGGSGGETYEVVTCAELPQADLSGGCTVEGTGSAKLIVGNVLGAGTVYVGGRVGVDSAGVITCVGCDCGEPEAGNTTKISCADQLVSPGLINAHDHIGWIHAYPAEWTERFDHRHDWRKGKRGHTRVSAGGQGNADNKMWGELRQVMSGTTSMSGSGSGK